MRGGQWVLTIMAVGWCAVGVLSDGASLWWLALAIGVMAAVVLGFSRIALARVGR